MKEFLLWKEAADWCFLAGAAVTGVFGGLVFREWYRSRKRRRKEKTVYLAVPEGTVPLAGDLVDGPSL